MNRPKLYRTSDGRVFLNGSQLTLHNGFWWWDVGTALAPEGAEKNLPLYDGDPGSQVTNGCVTTVCKTVPKG